MSDVHERVLITGANGQLGSDLSDQLADRAVVRATSHADLDIADDDAVARAVTEFQPDAVVNCAAFHNVDLCEREEEQAFLINATAVKRLAQRCASAGARLVHFSTNYVFDGTASEPYGESDLPNPRSAYAISKLAGEYSALAYGGPRTLVVRGSGLYGMHGSGAKGGNFVTRVLRRAREEGEVTMVADQRLQPTYTADLAGAVIEALDRDAHGVLHLTAGDSCSWLEFSEEIFAIAGIAPKVIAVATTPRPGVADRPLNGVLRSERRDVFGITALRPWRAALQHYMQRAGYAGGGV